VSVHRALLHRLARRAGISTDWSDAWGTPHTVPGESLAALLNAMGVAVRTDASARASLKRRTQTQAPARPAALVVDAERALSLPLPVPAAGKDWALALEDGRTLEGKAVEDDGMLALPPLPEGYHRLVFPADEVTVRIIASPGTCYLPPATATQHWGLATQLYGLRSAEQWGMGDFTNLGRLGAAVSARGGALVGINPLHALFPAAPERISPYSPSSRLFLNPLYIDVAAVPDLAECDAARARMATAWFAEQLAAARAVDLVDYPAVARLKSDVLRLLWRSFRQHHLGVLPTARGLMFRRFQEAAGAALLRFAQFHVLQAERIEREGFAWKDWPATLRSADAPEVAAFSAAHEDAILYHQYLQWEADRQLGEAAKTGALPIGLYRDLAIGADPYGADTWSDPASYITGASVGAPPDLLNRQGQNWGLTAYSPMALRAQGFEPFIEALRANMRHAGALRIDHVMGLRQLFLVPDGAAAADRGAYIRYPFEDMIRILALESRRQRCLIVGEDLGTVPHGFRPRMARANVLSCRVLMFERAAGERFKSPTAYPPLAAASAATHDLPPVRGWWLGTDIAVRQALGLYPSAAARHRDEAARALDRPRLVAALRRQGLLPPDLAALPADEFDERLTLAVHRFLARTPSILVMVQAEDVLGLDTMVNLPGTLDQHPNWRRRLAMTVADFADDPRFEALATLRPPGAAERRQRHG